LVNAALFQVLGSAMVFAFSFFLAYCVGALECYPGVCLFENIGNFPNFGAMIIEGGLFLVLVIFGWLFVVHFSFL
jgi:hypothetical protein